jgi:hypothetical protein
MGRLKIFALLSVTIAFASVTSSAFGWAEGDVTFDGDVMDCPACHQSELFFPDRAGPHGGYTATTSKCAACHSVHDAPGDGVLLLPASTIKASCEFCHDGTAGMGVYGAIEARGGTVLGGHSIDATNVVPGGDAGTGGSSVGSFGGESGYLSCDDCHSAHDARTVDAFSGERVRFHASDRSWLTSWASSKLLKRLPTGAEDETDVYGSDWCAGCHAGRSSGGAVHNHPVDSRASTATPFSYDHVAIVTADDSLETTYGTLGLLGFPPGIWHNRGFVMPDPRTDEQAGHAPICQQCHEDSRVVGEPGAVVPAEVYRYGDGRTSGDAGTDNPLFQNFPHETENRFMLVETDDNLCLNCHSVSSLP